MVGAVQFVEPSESLFAAAVRDAFVDVRRHGFDVVEPLVYGCTFFNGTRAVTVSYDRHQRSVRSVLQERLAPGQQPTPPAVNVVTELTDGEQPVAHQLARVLASHMATIAAAI
jgi:hypothetical protein